MALRAFGQEWYKCPACKDTGWELYTAMCGHEIYGKDYPLDFARRCGKCGGGADVPFTDGDSGKSGKKAGNRGQ